jgi:hypothetical protein
VCCSAGAGTNSCQTVASTGSRFHFSCRWCNPSLLVLLVVLGPDSCGHTAAAGGRAYRHSPAPTFLTKVAASRVLPERRMYSACDRQPDGVCCTIEHLNALTLSHLSCFYIAGACLKLRCYQICRCEISNEVRSRQLAGMGRITHHVTAFCSYAWSNCMLQQTALRPAHMCTRSQGSGRHRLEDAMQHSTVAEFISCLPGTKGCLPAAASA